MAEGLCASLVWLIAIWQAELELLKVHVGLLTPLKVLLVEDLLDVDNLDMLVLGNFVPNE